MSGYLTHQPAEIIQKLTIDLGFGNQQYPTQVAPGAIVAIPPYNQFVVVWPVYFGFMPDPPDSALCVYDTSGVLEGRTMSDSEPQEQYGFQIKFRCAEDQINQVATNARWMTYAFGQLLRQLVFVPGDGQRFGADYLVQAITRRSTLLSLGRESPTTRRRLFTMNFTASIYMLEADTGTGSSG